MDLKLTKATAGQSVWTLPDAYRLCEKYASSHYENFPVASFFMPSWMRRYVAAIYSFARIADDIADDPKTSLAEKLDALNAWEELLLESSEDERQPVFLALHDTIVRFGLPTELFQDLLLAFRSDAACKEYATWEELLEYCRSSANPIGRLLLHLFNYKNDQLFRLSDKLCTALQLINFWQDISVDTRNGRCFIPHRVLHEYAVAPEELRENVASPRIRKMIWKLVMETDAILESGRPLLRCVGSDLRLELNLTYQGGKAILRKIQKQNYDTLAKRPVLTGSDKVLLLLRTLITK